MLREISLGGLRANPPAVAESGRAVPPPCRIGANQLSCVSPLARASPRAEYAPLRRVGRARPSGERKERGKGHRGREAKSRVGIRGNSGINRASAKNGKIVGADYPGWRGVAAARLALGQTEPSESYAQHSIVRSGCSCRGTTGAHAKGKGPFICTVELCEAERAFASAVPVAIGVFGSLGKSGCEQFSSQGADSPSSAARTPHLVHPDAMDAEMRCQAKGKQGK